MTRKVMLVVVAVAAGLILARSTANAQTQMQVYGLWHCYSDACSWASVPNMTTFDTGPIIGSSIAATDPPSANLVMLSFVDPVKLMNRTNDSTTVNGIPIGMTTAVVNYFQSKGIRVMMSVGGFSYTKNWDKALGNNPTQLELTRRTRRNNSTLGWRLITKRAAIRT